MSLAGHTEILYHERRPIVNRKRFANGFV